MFHKKNLTCSVLASLALAISSQVAAADEFNPSNSYGDEYGNVVLHKAGRSQDHLYRRAPQRNPTSWAGTSGGRCRSTSAPKARR